MNSSLLILFIVLLNSVWQLPALYYAVKLLDHDQAASPTYVRRQLLFTILFQWLISTTSFLIFYFQIKPVEFPQIFSVLNIHNFTNPIAVKLLAAVYFIFLLYKVSQQVFMLLGIRQLSSRIEISADTRYTKFIKDWSKKLNLSSNIKLSLSSNLETAFTYGHFRPIIVLPLSMITMLSPAQIESILLHEIAHIKNKDFIVNIFLEISEAVFSFNPFMWKITKEIKIKREQACDEFVIQQGVDSSIYASALYELALAKTNAKFGLAAVGKKKYLLARIQSLTSYKEYSKKKNTWAYLLGLAIFSILAANAIEISKKKNTVVALNKTTKDVANLPNKVSSPITFNKKLGNALNENNVLVKAEAKNEILKKEKTSIKVSIIIDKDNTTYDITNATYVDNNTDKDKTVAILQEENSDGTVTMMAIEINVVNGSNQLTPLWKWQSRPISADSIRKNFIATDSLRKYQ